MSNKLEPARKLRNVSHSLTKPLKSGSPAIEQQPTSTAVPVSGIRRCKPPSSFKLTECVAFEIAPAPRNSRLLNRAWLKACRSAATSARAAPSRRMMCQENQRCSQPQKDDADVFHAAVSQQPLQVVLGNCIQNAEKSGDGATSKTTYPDHQGPPPRKSKAKRTNPYTAVFNMTPDISAETGLGAIG